MKRLCEHTAYLIARHDCVVLPGWGALIAMRDNARIDPASSTVVPPSRRLTFNGMITHDDGMLASSVARREGVSYEAAAVMIANDLDSLRRHFHTDGSVTLDRIGRFDNHRDKPVFTPDTASAANMPFKALTPAKVSALPAQEEAGETKKRKDNIIYIPLSRNIFKIAASLVLFISMAMLAWTSLPVDRMPDEASLAPKARTERVNVQPAPAPSVTTVITSDPAPSADQPAAAASHEPTVVDGPRFEASDNYYLIIASLPTKDDAEKYILSSHETSRLDILEQDGRFRVYIATGTTQSDAMAQRDVQGIADRHPEAWVCRRR